MYKIIINALLIALAMPVDVQARTTIDETIPIDVQAACDIYGAQYNICPELLEAIIYHESRYQPDVENGTCKGLMQINTPCHKERMEKLEITDIYDVYENVHVGADYLSELFEEYEDVGMVLAAYHGESDIYNISQYTESVLKMSADLERRHGK